MPELFNDSSKSLQLPFMMLFVISSGRTLAQNNDIENALRDAPVRPEKLSGIKFCCAPKIVIKLSRDMRHYFHELDIGTPLIIKDGPDEATLIYSLNTLPTDTNTWDFSQL